MAEGKKPKMPEFRPGSGKQVGTAAPDELEARRNRLEEELLRRGIKGKPELEEEPQVLNGMAQAIKLSSEFLAGVVVGVVIGLGLDRIAGTSPWGLIVFLFLGFAAGVLNVLRSVGRIVPSKIGQQGGRDNEGNGAKPD